MKVLKYSLVIIVFVLANACSNATNEQKQVNPATEVITPEDSVYKMVIHLHDEAMPKIGKLIGFQKTAQQQIDSISKLKAPAMKAYVEKLQQVKTQLAGAEKAMNEWMEHFDPDPKMPTTEERLAYFIDQQKKAQKMRNDIFAALDSAAAIIK